MRILVVGDIMLDQYLFCGESARHNPEHPEGIILPVEKWNVSLGGAAAVAHLLKCFGVDVRLVGVIGCDWAGHCVGNLVQRLEIPTHVWKLEERLTTTKLRVVRAGRVVSERLDFEQTHTVERSIIPLIDGVISSNGSVQWVPDSVVVADYAKGACRDDDMEAIVRSGCPVYVDPPRSRTWSSYRGAALIKCNMDEGRAVLPDDPPVPPTAAATARMLNIILGSPIVVTNGDQGMAWSDGDSIHTQPAVAPWRVQDPCGCGDTVMAVLACLRTAGLSWAESMRAAAMCAAEQLGNWGVHPISLPPEFRHLAEGVAHQTRPDQVREPRPALGDRPAIVSED